MDYKYDVFISYRRDELTKYWIEKIFIPILESHIFYDLGRLPVFYIDAQLESGTTWPVSLGTALGSSRTMITLWSKNYLNSVWCTCEITHMLQRELQAGYRTAQNPGGLLFPIIIHDGETMPINLTLIQKLEIKQYFNVKMSPDSPNAEILADKLKPLAEVIAAAIDNAPECQNDWKIDSINSFYERFYNNSQASQNKTPKFTDQ